ncbi:hypothetical protein THAOC_33565, partial [Thalassiosira oceanica]
MVETNGVEARTCDEPRQAGRTSCWTEPVRAGGGPRRSPRGGDRERAERPRRGTEIRKRRAGAARRRGGARGRGRGGDAPPWETSWCSSRRDARGCELAAGKRGMWDCPFCRTHTSDEENALARIRKRVAAGDPQAIFFLGSQYHYGKYGLEKDVTRALELYERAAELGAKDAHYNLGFLYDEGTDVEKDLAKAIRHYEAAMCGHVSARYNLGGMEYNAGNYDLALQHWMISAKLGHVHSLNYIKSLFISGLASKADYAAALRGHQNAIKEMSSPDRDQAKAV